MSSLRLAKLADTDSGEPEKLEEFEFYCKSSEVCCGMECCDGGEPWNWTMILLLLVR